MNTKNRNILVRVSDDEHALYKRAAIDLGVTMSDVARGALKRMARRAERQRK